MSKKKKIGIAVACLCAVTFGINVVRHSEAHAKPSTSQVQQAFLKGESHAVRARVGLIGLKLDSMNAKCAPIAPGQFSCYTTYTVSAKGYHLKYGLLVNIKGPRLTGKPEGNATLLRSW